METSEGCYVGCHVHNLIGVDDGIIAGLIYSFPFYCIGYGLIKVQAQM